MVADWIKRAIIWNAFIFIIFVMLVIYLTAIKDQASVFRDAGMVIAGGFIGSAVYDMFKKIYPTFIE
jgi:hypothetical protein